MNAFRYGVPAFIVLALLLSNPLLLSQTAVSRQAGFPTLDSEALSSHVLRTALGGERAFLNVNQSYSGDWVKSTKLLVQPYKVCVSAPKEPAK